MREKNWSLIKRIELTEAKTGCNCKKMTVCKHERTQGTLNGYSADELTHRETIMVAQQPELTRVVGARVLMFQTLRLIY